MTRGAVPFVSVILPTVNRSSLLEEALRTVCEQDYPRELYEIIVVDNNSSDDTEGRVRRFALTARVDLTYIREERRGLVFARHSGAVHSRGDILVFGDDDALYDRNWISALIDVYLRYPEVGAAGTAIEIKWDRPPAPWVKSFEAWLGKIEFGPHPVVQRGLFINGGSFSVRKEILYAVKGFNPGQIGECLVGDCEVGLCVKLAAAGIPVAGISAAKVWHLQFREKNGTFRDVRRRLRNNGISLAYGDTFHGKGLARVLYSTFRAGLGIGLEILVRFLRGDTERLGIYALLMINEFWYRLKYLVVFRLNPKMKSEINKRDWELTPGFTAPEPEFYFRACESLSDPVELSFRSA